MEHNGLLQNLRTSRHVRRIVGLSAACFLASSMVGCYGRFPITNGLYRWNGRVTNNTFVNSLIMIVLAIIPVYGLMILIDAIIVNSIEYWGGARVDVTQTATQSDGSVVAFGPGAAENEAVLTITRDDVVVARRTMVRDDAGVTTIHDESGAVVSYVTPDGQGGFVFTDGQHQPKGALGAAEIADLRANAGAGATPMLMASTAGLATK